MTRLERLENDLHLQLWQARLDSGLSIRIDSRPRRRTGFAALGADFGSIDRSLGADEGQAELPAGTAHFLEHELFEDEQGDVSDRFAAMGAASNAMTGFMGTSFVVNTRGDMLPAIELLLQFVQAPVFADERVARERAVIAQEIAMYDDDPDWRLFEGLLGCLFERHPVRDNIAGSAASIAGIDAALLRRAHARGYGPGNLCLSVSGPVQAERVLALARADQEGRPSGPARVTPERGFDEPPRCASECWRRHLPVARPRLLLGIKETFTGGDGTTVARRRLATRMAFDLQFGRSSRAFEQLYTEGLIDESFQVSHSAEAGFGFTMLGGETDHPDLLEQRLRELLPSKPPAFDPGAHARIHHKLYGSLVRSLDQPDNVAFGLLSSCFRGVPPFAALDLVSAIDLEEISARWAEHVRPEAMAVASVLPGAP